MSHPSRSNETRNEPRQPHPWLLKHYQEKRERTLRLVKAAVDQLIKEKQAVTIEAICHKSSEIDPEGRGVKKSALLENQKAHAYYREHSASYRAAQTRKRTGKSARVSEQAHPLRIDPQRDVNRARYRYLQMTKPEIVERLLQVEQAYADLSEQQTRFQFAWAEREQQIEANSSKRQGRSTGNCYDNAVTESFFGTLKGECVERSCFQTRGQARQTVFEYVECFYVRSVQSKLAYPGEGMAGKDKNLDNS